jgi:DNA repair exonuclease SbcCD nuclease subunit
MKLILLSDLHLSWDNPIARMDDLVKIQFEKLRFVFDWVKSHGEPTILQAGDFFHTPRSWYTLSSIVDLLNEYIYHENGFEIMGIYGQHDTYLYSETTRDATNLGILNKIGLVDSSCTRRERSTLGGSVIVGCNYGEEVSSKDLSFLKKYESKILIIHAPISIAPLFPGHEITHADKFLEKHPEFDLILCGDIHRDFIIERKGRFIVNTGPMLRREATEFNFTHKPHFLVYDTEDRTIEKVEILHEPADKVLSREHIEQKEATELMLEDFIKLVKETTPGLVSKKDKVSFTDNLWAFIKENEIEQEIIDILSKVMEKGK